MEDIKNNGELNETQLEDANGGLQWNPLNQTRKCPRCNISMQLIGKTATTKVYKCAKCQQTYSFPR